MSEFGLGAKIAGTAASEIIKSKKLDGGDTSKKESKTQGVEQTEIKAKDGKDISSKGTAEGRISIIDEGFNPKPPHPICVLPTPDPIERKIKESIEKMLKEPKKAVEDIRTAKGADRDNALLGFQQKIDNMSQFQLKEMRDYLVKEMASPTNKDDELLGSLLNRVNKELDSRDRGHIIWNEIDVIPLQEKIHEISSIGSKVSHKASDTINSVGKAVAEGGSKVSKGMKKLED